MGIVRGELRQDRTRVREQTAHAGEIGNVRGEFSRVDRVSLQTSFLAALDLAIPVRPFHQAYGHAAAMLTSRGSDPVDHVQCAFAVGLHGQAQPRPLPRLRIGRQGFDDIQRKIQPIRLLGVDGELHAERCGAARQIEYAGDQPRHDAVMLQQGITRLQRR